MISRVLAVNSTRVVYRVKLPIVILAIAIPDLSLVPMMLETGPRSRSEKRAANKIAAFP